MKRHYLILCLAALIIGCSTNEQRKAEKLSAQYLKTNLHDPNSYESVSFSNLDTVWYHHSLEIKNIETQKSNIIDKFSDVIRIRNLYHYLEEGENDLFDISTYKMDRDKVKGIRSMTKDDIYPYKKTVDSIAGIIENMDKEIDSIKNTPPKHTGFKLQHKYRAKNKMGAKNLSTIVFHLDNTLTQVLGYEDE